MEPIHLSDCNHLANAGSGSIRTGDIVSILELEGKDLLKAKNGFNTFVFIRFGGLDLALDAHGAYTNLRTDKCVIGCINSKPDEKLKSRISYLEVDIANIKVEQKIGMNRYVFYMSPRNRNVVILARVTEYSFLRKYDHSDDDQYTYYEITETFTEGPGYCQIGSHFRNLVLQHPDSADTVGESLEILDDALYAMQLANVKRMDEISHSIKLTDSIETIVENKKLHNNLCWFNDYITNLKSTLCLKPSNSRFLNKNKQALFKLILGRDPH
jgi:hypothetical protein